MMTTDEDGHYKDLPPGQGSSTNERVPFIFSFIPSYGDDDGP